VQLKQDNNEKNNSNMAKKTKINSKNPKYSETMIQKTSEIKKLECTTNNGVKVYSVWDEKNYKK